MKYWISVLCIVILISQLYVSYVRKEGFDTTEKTIGDVNNVGTVIHNTFHHLPRKIFVINLDRNVDRYTKFNNEYSKTGLSSIPCTRFSAIDGKRIHPEKHLTSEALDELSQVEMNKYRTRHYQLTRGGIGCFLSHVTLAKQLLEDTTTDSYLIFEDDIEFQHQSARIMNDAIRNAPDDWDMITLGHIRLVSEDTEQLYMKPRAFWGMQCYVLNKKGAKKIVNEVNKTKIDGQIDSYLSVMSQQDKLNIYVYKYKIVQSNTKTSDIQIGLRMVPGVNPFLYKGYLV